MTWETKDEIEDERIPEGYSVTFHQIRGYDSPTKWYEAHCGERLIGEFGRKEEAITACKKDNKSKLTNDQKIEIQNKAEWEGPDYYFSSYVSSKYLAKEYKDKKLVELYDKYMQARKELFNYVGLEL